MIYLSLGSLPKFILNCDISPPYVYLKLYYKEKKSVYFFPRRKEKILWEVVVTSWDVIHTLIAAEGALTQPSVPPISRIAQQQWQQEHRRVLCSQWRKTMARRPLLPLLQHLSTTPPSLSLSATTRSTFFCKWSSTPPFRGKRPEEGKGRTETFQ